MFTGLEYVLVAYGIWVSTLVVYIFVTKRRIKIINKTIATLEKRSIK